MELFKSGGEQVTRPEIIEWMKKEDEPEFKEMSDLHLAAFLNGLINEKRGKKEGEQPKPESKLNNNIILRRLRFTFDISDLKMIELFASGGKIVTRTEISNWMKPEEDTEFQEMEDINLAAFLNGFINDKRGQKEGEQPEPEKSLNNNIILRKLKIALNYKDEDILDVLDLVKFRLSKSELSAFFRKPDHQNYRPLKDQILRNFILGLQLKYKPESAK